MLIIGCSNSKDLAKSVAKKLNQEYSELNVKHFPDGELYIKFETEVKNKEVILVQTFKPANEAILEVILARDTAKELGAKKVILVCPYLAYIRQDKRFNDGEAVSSKVIGNLLKDFDKVITIDPHLHRYKSVSEMIKTKTEKLSANDLIKNYIKNNYKNPIIIGPDEESYQWAKEIADSIGSNAAILKKQRFSATRVKEVLESPIDVKNKDVIIIDDILSTGKTILEAIRNIKEHKTKSINVIAIHGVFADLETYKKIKKLTKSLITTNTINNSNAKIDVSSLIANSLK